MKGKKERKRTNQQAGERPLECCRVRAVVTVDERGQMVLPKDLREELQIRAGDKLALIAMRGDKGLCCLMLMKADKLSNAVRITMGPVLNDLNSLA